MQVEVAGEQLQVERRKAAFSWPSARVTQYTDLRVVHLRQADAQDEHEGQQERRGRARGKARR